MASKLLRWLQRSLGGPGRVSAQDREEVHRLFRGLQSEFPQLHAALREELEDGQPYLVLDFAQQPGMQFPLRLTFFADSLLMQGGGDLPMNDAFAWEVFPCTKREVREAFAAMVQDIVTGKRRVLVQYVQNRRRIAVIQSPTDGGWDPVPDFPSRADSEIRVFQNGGSSAA